MTQPLIGGKYTAQELAEACEADAKRLRDAQPKPGVPLSPQEVYKAKLEQRERALKATMHALRGW